MVGLSQSRVSASSALLPLCPRHPSPSRCLVNFTSEYNAPRNGRGSVAKLRSRGLCRDNQCAAGPYSLTHPRCLPGGLPRSPSPPILPGRPFHLHDVLHVRRSEEKGRASHTGPRHFPKPDADQQHAPPGQAHVPEIHLLSARDGTGTCGGRCACTQLAGVTRGGLLAFMWKCGREQWAGWGSGLCIFRTPYMYGWSASSHNGRCHLRDTGWSSRP